MFDFHKKDLENAERLWKENVKVSESGIVSWISNGRHPFDDMLDLFIENGHENEFNKEMTSTARDEKASKDLEDYRSRLAAPSEDEISEMRSEFGAGSTVVDVISGRKISL